MFNKIMSIPGQTTREEIEFLTRLAGEFFGCPTVVELGCFSGRSTAALCLGAGAESVTAYDNFTMQHHGANRPFYTELNLEGLGFGDVTVVKADSVEAAKTYSRLMLVDLLFIDTDHTERGLLRELGAWTNRMNVGGIIALHDYGNERWPDVQRVADSFFQSWAVVGQAGLIKAYQVP